MRPATIAPVRREKQIVTARSRSSSSLISAPTFGSRHQMSISTPRGIGLRQRLCRTLLLRLLGLRGGGFLTAAFAASVSLRSHSKHNLRGAAETRDRL
jgi:hypothetical protein